MQRPLYRCITLIPLFVEALGRATERRPYLPPFHCPVPPVLPNERNSTQGTAALRDFEPV
jgi:hypothetical protein